MSILSNHSTFGAFTKLYISGPEKRVAKVVDGQVVRDEAGNIVEEVIQWERPECPICLLPIEASEDVYIRDDCGHVFHQSCVEQHVRSAGRPEGCPVCRRQIPQNELLKLRGDPLTALQCAAEGNLHGLLTILNANPSAVNSVNADGYTPLMMAIWYGHAEVACALLRSTIIRGTRVRVDVRSAINCNAVESVFGNTALHLACELGGVLGQHGNNGNNMSLVVELLLFEGLGFEPNGFERPRPSGTRVNVQNRYGYTPLMCCVESGNTSAARALLSHPDIDVNLADRNGFTPLMTACARNRIEIARCLITHDGIDFSRRNNVGATALVIAKEEYLDFVEEMILERQLKLRAAAGGAAGPDPKRVRPGI